MNLEKPIKQSKLNSNSQMLLDCGEKYNEYFSNQLANKIINSFYPLYQNCQFQLADVLCNEYKQTNLRQM